MTVIERVLQRPALGRLSAAAGRLLRQLLARLLHWRPHRRLRFNIKHYLPRTLFGRSLMIIVTPVLLMQAIAVFYFYDKHWEMMTRRLSYGVAGEIAMVIELFELAETQEERNALFTRAARTMALVFTWEPGAELAPPPEVWGNWILQDELNDALADRVARPFTANPQVLDKWAEIRVQLNGGIIDVLVPRRRLFSYTSQVFILWMVGSGIVLFAVALVFMRNQIRPIRRLAVAADNFGKGRDVTEFRLEGATEVRQAARAFLIMRDRIKRQISQRTDMLSGVSHDLRTPLTRMKLQLAMLGDDPDIAELKADVAEMETMIEGYLAFARGEGTEEADLTDLPALLQDLVMAARREGAFVDLLVNAPIVLPLRPQAFRRCIANLLSNARRHASHIWVQAEDIDGLAQIVIDDDGPGIPEDQLEEVFKAFYRIDRSRNQATGGTGLGLTIARDVARNHGGDIKLTRSPAGGLRAIIRLPI